MNSTNAINANKTNPKQSRTFIQVVEIWTPTADLKKLTLVDGLFNGNENFQRQSQKRCFSYNEGLPGKAWSSARPQIIRNIAFSFLRRKEEAIKAGLNSAIAIPIFTGEFLQAVVVFLCGEDEDHSGAIELWGTNTKSRTKLSLLDGYYGNLKTFEWVSKQLMFSKGSGLPGNVWNSLMPEIISELGNSTSFERAKNAKEANITTGLGIPIRNYLGEEYVLTFLSAMGTPIARHFEIWIPDKTNQHLILFSSHSDGEKTNNTNDTIEIKRGQGLLGIVWMTGCPAVSHNLIEDGIPINEDSPTGYNSALIMPINDEGKLRAIVNFIF
jgi:hypothetical protein